MKYLVQPLPPHAAHAPTYPGNESRTYAIASAASGLALTATGSHQPVRQRPWTGAKSQQWRIFRDGTTFKLVNVDRAELLDVSGGSDSNGAVVQTWTSNNTKAQRWKLVEVAFGHFQLVNAGSGKALDLDDGARLSESAQIQQWTPHDRDNQRWILSELRPASERFEGAAALFTEPGYQGPRRDLGLGSYSGPRLPLPLRALRLAPGLRATLYAQDNFRGDHIELLDDSPDISAPVASLVIEKVATLYAEPGFRGASLALGVGRYDLTKGPFPNDALASLRVPQGLLVYVYEHVDFQGDFRTYGADADDLRDLKARASSIVIKEPGVIIPAGAVHFGDAIQLRSVYGHYLTVTPRVGARSPVAGAHATFTVTRLGPTTHKDLVSFGDILGLDDDGLALALGDKPGRADNRDGMSALEKKRESFELLRAGPSQSTTFLADGDRVALRAASHDGFVVLKVLHDGKLTAVDAALNNLPDAGIFTVVRPAPADEAAHENCGAAVCGAAACPHDYCGAAACGAATSIVGVCGVAARGVAICGVDLGGAGFCGAAACGAAVVGFAACGADACNAAACGAAACGAAACGAAACGAAATGADACGAAVNSVGVCGADACGAEAGGIDACGADACGANVCGINLCPVDACAADACGLDIIPIIPGI